MKLYIAGSSKELDRAELWIDRVKETGLTITFDWTVPIREKGSGNTLAFAEKRGYAVTDRNAILEADAFWLLLPADHTSFGACWEFGFACACQDVGQPMRTARMHVIVSGARSDAHIFTTLANAHFDEDADALEYLLRCHYVLEV